MVTLTTIKDTRVRIRASEELKQVFLINQEKLQELPRRLAKELEGAGFKVHSNVQLIELNQENSMKDKSTHFNIKKLREVLKKTQWQENPSDLLKTSKKGSKKQELNTELKNEKSKSGIDTEIYLYLDELRWLKNFLDQLRQDEDNVQQSFYLNDLLENCQLELPKNGFLERNPELEARCQQLRMQEQNREYLRMTKNVDAVHKHYPEDTFGYQIKAINAQVIAIVQFIFSVVAGFVFGFFGLQLIFGSLDFGFRLLLGVIFALIVALAEIYFLAKKLTEYDDAIDGKSNPLHLD